MGRWIAAAGVVMVMGFCPGCGTNCEKACTHRQKVECDHKLSLQNLRPEQRATLEATCNAAPFSEKCLTECKGSWRDQDMECVTQASTLDDLAACEKAQRGAAESAPE